MKEEQEQVFQSVDKKSQVIITGWLDNKPVLMLSNYLGKNPTDECSNYDR